MKNRDYSTTYRLLHWSIAFCFMVLLLTIFLRSTWLNKNQVANIIQEHLSTTNQSLTQEQAVLIAKKIRKPMWDWHIYFGYALVVLYAIRLMVPFLGIMKFTNPLQKDYSIRQKFQYSLYIVFYVCVAISLTTGLVMMFGPKNLGKPAEEIHVLSIYYLLTFIILHIGGVIMAELTNQKGLVSRIISGRKSTFNI